VAAVADRVVVAARAAVAKANLRHLKAARVSPRRRGPGKANHRLAKTNRANRRRLPKANRPSNSRGNRHLLRKANRSNHHLRHQVREANHRPRKGNIRHRRRVSSHHNQPEANLRHLRRAKANRHPRRAQTTTPATPPQPQAK
jgi:hypothetical protein